jgi:uncharacterized membrane protein (TIGR01666 family)
MDYVKEYKNFINSHYLSEGARITAGIVLPSVVLSYFHLLSTGIVFSIGAMAVGLADTIGPIHHRINGMKACLISTFLVSLFIGMVAPYPILLAVLLVAVSFIFSMIGVYGSRANSIGTAVLLIMVLSTEHHHEGIKILYNALYILGGGLWYMLMSLLLYRARPYKLAQQALGDSILATAAYLRTRSAFYDKTVDYEATYRQVVQQQIVTQEKQALVRELLFKTRSIINDSTDTGRTLLMIFRDTLDLFERTMTSYQDYEALHRYFADNDILSRYQAVMLEIANELDDIALAVKIGNSSKDDGLLQKHLTELHQYFDGFVEQNRTHENVEGFISLRHILNALEDIAVRVHTLHLYTMHEIKQSKSNPSEAEYEKFITHTVIDVKLIFDNFSLQSNTFRHALRVSVAVLCGYIVSLFLQVGHGYWILLTIIVILKPAYSLSKKRNYERLIGTIAGALFGLVILYFIHDNNVLFGIMLLLMVVTYSLFRTNYLVSIFFMTPYILLMFHLLFSANTKMILVDRITDTAIGSVIAFIANLFLVPAWERSQIKNYMAKALEANILYFKNIAAAFTGTANIVTEYKLKRKNAFVSLANLSDAFARMLQEPKNKQVNAKLIYQFVTLNHMLTSHIATLSYYTEPLATKYNSEDFNPIIASSLKRFEQAELILMDKPAITITEERNNALDQKVNALLEKRKAELREGLIETETKRTLSEFKSIADQFNFISKISVDMEKVCGQMVKGEEELKMG